jgi:predicted TIM-barrel fold metal-dependent hydrolase
MLGVDLPALTANMRAANRWQAAARHAGKGRLNPVGHMTLRDAEWAEDEIANLAGAGIRLAMIGPAPVNGKPLSDPSLDRIWSAFVHHGVSPVFHVSGFEPPLHPAWYSTDKEPVDSVMGSVFLWVAPAVAVADMTINGVFERHPELRLGIVELSANWVPMFLLNLDGASDFYSLRHGGPLVDLPLRPSEYVKRNVRVSVLAYERPAHLVERVSDEMFMYGSDWPHAEGIADPLGDYTRQVEQLDDERRGRLLGDNVAWLLHQ